MNHGRRTKLIRVAVGFLTLFSGVGSYALPPNSESASFEQSRLLADSVMKRIAAGDDRGALELMRSQFPVGKKDFDTSRDRTLSERRDLSGRFGKIVGIQLVREERVADFLVRITYVEKRSIHLIRWQFFFYRPHAEWRLNAYTWDDNVSALFDQAAK